MHLADGWSGVEVLSAAIGLLAGVEIVLGARRSGIFLDF